MTNWILSQENGIKKRYKNVLMRRTQRYQVLRKYCFYYIAILLLIALWNEYIATKWYIRKCTKNSSLIDRSDQLIRGDSNKLSKELVVNHWNSNGTDHILLSILAISDIQIQGIKNEPGSFIGSITRFDSDRYMARAFENFLNYNAIDLVTILGDLFDEGSIATDQEYESYLKRMNHILSPWGEGDLLRIAGDNDIGGEGNDILTNKKVNRFKKYFGDLNFVWKRSGFTFVTLTTLCLWSHVCMEETWQFIRRVAENEKNIILLSHISFQDLPRETSINLISTLKPLLILTGDRHIFKISSHKTDTFEVYEVSVPTLSYRMGTKTMGGVLLKLFNAGEELHVDILYCRLPDRYFQLFGYIFIVVFFVVGYAFIYFVYSRSIHNKSM